MEPLYQGGGGHDEDESHHDGAEDTIEEHPVVVSLLHAERHEELDHDEDVVDGEGLLDEIASDVFQGEILAIFDKVVLVGGFIRVEVDMIVIFGGHLDERLVVVDAVQNFAFITDQQKKK